MKDYRKYYAQYYNIQWDSSLFDVHHIDRNRDNNDIRNLVLLPRELHKELHQVYNEFDRMLAFEKDPLRWNQPGTNQEPTRNQPGTNQEPTPKQPQNNPKTTPNVNENVNVNGNVKVTRKPANHELTLPFQDPEFVTTWNELRQQPKWRKKTTTALQKSLDQLGQFHCRFAVLGCCKGIPFPFWRIHSFFYYFELYAYSQQV